VQNTCIIFVYYTFFGHPFLAIFSNNILTNPYLISKKVHNLWKYS